MSEIGSDGVIPRNSVEVPMPERVVAFRAGQVVTGRANPEIVSMLERALEEARRGEIDGIAIGWSRPNDVAGTGYWFGEAGHRLTAAVGMLFHNVMRYANEESPDAG